MGHPRRDPQRGGAQGGEAHLPAGHRLLRRPQRAPASLRSHRAAPPLPPGHPRRLPLRRRRRPLRPAPPPRHAPDQLRLRHGLLPHLRRAHRRGRLPPRASARRQAGNVGLIVNGDDGSVMAAGLRPGGGDGTGRAAVLLSYKVGDCRKWREREPTAGAPPPPLPKDWLPDCVVSHGGMLWWVDLAYGLLALDPFAEEPRLVHVPLPPAADELPAVSVDDRVNRRARCCVRVSGGRLRCVQVHGGRDAPAVSRWALAESAAPAASCSGGEWEWNPERSVPLADFWIDAMLPLCVLPAVALLHPTDPDRVFFFLDSRIFGVDLRLRKLLGFNEFEMHRPPRGIGRKRSSRFVHAWQYDPSSTRSELVSTCLRQEKAIPVPRSFVGFNPAMPLLK